MTRMVNLAKVIQADFLDKTIQVFLEGKSMKKMKQIEGLWGRYENLAAIQGKKLDKFCLKIPQI